MSIQKLERTTFETHRSSEYFSAEELTKQTTQARENFPAVIFKELIDNALDACETAGVTPEVTIRTEELEETFGITVADNGPGIPPEVVGKILNFETRTSDKAAYRSPTRGAQGNALKTVVGIPYALGTKKPVVIEAHGVKHVIKPFVNPAGKARISHEVEDSDVRTGTRVTVAFPRKEVHFHPDYWALAASLFNPHAFVKLERFSGDNQHGNSRPALTQVYKPTVEGFKKYVPKDPMSPHWYTHEDMQKLIGAHVGHAWDGGDDLPLGAFVRKFKGLTSTAKAKAVCQRFGRIKRLSDLAGEDGGLDRFKIAVLLDTMKKMVPSPTHKGLGRIDKAHFEERFEETYIVKRPVDYRHVEGYLPNGLPYTFEFAICEIDQYSSERELFVGVNHSPTFGDPLVDVRLKGSRYQATGIEGFLEEGFAHPEYYSPDDPSGADTVVVAHVITPAPLFMEKGKTKLDIKRGS